MEAPKLEKLLVSYPELGPLGIKYTREHITRLVRQGKFPKPIRLGGDDQSTRLFWKYRNLVEWIEERARISESLPTKRGNLDKTRPAKTETDGQRAKSRRKPAPYAESWP